MEKTGKVLVVGAGDIGSRIIVGLETGRDVVATTSGRSGKARLRRLGTRPVLANLDKPATLRRLPRDCLTLFHCAPPPVSGRRDTRTRNLLRALGLAPGTAPDARPGSLARAIVYLSTTGVYGDRGGELVSEACAPAPSNARALRRVDAERSLARAARRAGMRLVILRVPGIYSESRLPLDRIRAGTPAIVDNEDSYTNHIHAADLATIARAAARRMARRARPLVRIYNACDDSELKMGEWFDQVARAFDLPPPPRLPREAVRERVSPMLYSFMRESRRLSNARMKLELRVRLQFPTVAEGLAAARAAL